MIKQFLKQILSTLGIDITLNQKYDRFTESILKKVLTKDSVCVDIGCHKGEVLDIMIKYASESQHYGIEPIPSMCKELQKRYPGHHIFCTALSDDNGTAEFQLVKNAPAYSGLRKRDYDGRKVEIETIEVQVQRLDDIIAEGKKVDLIKIDVEGAELGVLKGSRRIIGTYKPYVLFEHGKGAADHYGTKPGDVFSFFREFGMGIYTLDGFLSGEPALGEGEFERQFEGSVNYYFIAH